MTLNVRYNDKPASLLMLLFTQFPSAWEERILAGAVIALLCLLQYQWLELILKISPLKDRLLKKSLKRNGILL